jgi:hypothetical protein
MVLFLSFFIFYRKVQCQYNYIYILEMYKLNHVYFTMLLSCYMPL